MVTKKGYVQTSVPFWLGKNLDFGSIRIRDQMIRIREP